MSNEAELLVPVDSRALKAATDEVESGFEIWDDPKFEGKCRDYSRTLSGQKYVIVTSCGVYEEPPTSSLPTFDTEEEAIDKWKVNLLSQKGRYLYWRIKPELGSCSRGYAVYSRLVVSDKSPSEQFKEAENVSPDVR